jgi:hypothetical protein
LRWLFRWREREPGNAAPEAIDPKPTTGCEGPAEAIPQVPRGTGAVSEKRDEVTGQELGTEERTRVPMGRQEPDVSDRPVAIDPNLTRTLPKRTGPKGRLIDPRTLPFYPLVSNCGICHRPERDILDAAEDSGQSLSSCAKTFRIAYSSLKRHRTHRAKASGRVKSDSDAAQPPSAGDGGLAGQCPEGEDPLLWELGQFRRIVQGAVAQSAKSRNHVATASLVRAGNGLLDLLSKIEKAKAEEAARKAAMAFTEDRQAIKARLHQKLDLLAARMRQTTPQAEAAQQPPEPPAMATEPQGTPETAAKSGRRGGVH